MLKFQTLACPIFFIILLVSITACDSKKADEKDTISIGLDGNDSDKSGNKQFTLLDSDDTGIDFVNLITPDFNSKENLFDFDYFYNGAGVGIADLNNDGLPDIIFTGNQVPNRIYHNLGNLKFKDVTDGSGINIGKSWSNGITFADVNKDGFLDIYISQGGPHKRELRKNLLFINKGNMTFEEKAEMYNLGDDGISTQSAFFDFDQDGDLDCIVMNESELYGYDPIRFNAMLKNDQSILRHNSAKLYENIDGHYKDITESAGLLNPVFGLGLVVSDINDDNWPDIYIASDYYIPDALYINNKDGTFTNEIKNRLGNTAFFGMGADIADLNNDGLQDIFVLDMASADHKRSKTLMASMNTERFDYLVNEAKYHYQYMFNALQLNMGNNKYGNIANLAGVAKTDWSWAGLIADLDNDSDKDIYVTNGYRQYALDNDFQRKVANTQRQYSNAVPLNVKEALYYEMPTEKLPNIMFENSGNLKFQDNSKVWGLDQPSFSNGASLGDLDNDGDLDIVVNNLDHQAFVYQNNSDSTSNKYLKVKTTGKTSEDLPIITIIHGSNQQVIENKRVRGYMSALEDVAIFGLGQSNVVDALTVTWPSGLSQSLYNITANQTINLYEKDATERLDAHKNTESKSFESISPEKFGLNHEHKENIFNDFEKEILLPYKQSQYGPAVTQGDLNNDGKLDLFIGGSSGELGRVYIKNDNGYKEISNTFLLTDKKAEDVAALIADINGDGLNDLLVISGGNEHPFGSDIYRDRLYINEGEGNFRKKDQSEISDNLFSGGDVEAIDYDKDGDVDIIVGNRIIPQSYPKHAPSAIFENLNGKLVNKTTIIAPELQNFGIINDIEVTDFNNDGLADFIAVGEWSKIGFFENTGTSFKLLSEDVTSIIDTGWWFSVKETDINQDGLKDYVVGNIGQNIKLKTNQSTPLKLFFNDFDNNGSQDLVLGNTYKGVYVPVRGRECSSQQMPFISEKFPTFNEFASASLDDIYGKNLENALELEVTEFNSVLLLNHGNGKFSSQPLPLLAQSFPIRSIVFKDLNGDNLEDAIVGGNLYETEVETPRLDALSGLILYADKNKGYVLPKDITSHPLVKGNVRQLELLTIGDNSYLFSIVNNGEHSLFRIKKDTGPNL